jgi:hypothetical protein
MSFELPNNYQENRDNQTPESLRKGAEKIINIFCSKFEVVGKNNIEKIKKENPDDKFIVTSSHFSNLDGQPQLRS